MGAGYFFLRGGLVGECEGTSVGIKFHAMSGTGPGVAVGEVAF